MVVKLHLGVKGGDAEAPTHPPHLSPSSFTHSPHLPPPTHTPFHVSRRYPPQADQALLEPKRGFLGMMGERGVGGSKCGSTAAVALLYTAPKGGRWVEVEVEVEVTWV